MIYYYRKCRDCGTSFRTSAVARRKCEKCDRSQHSLDEDDGSRNSYTRPFSAIWHHPTGDLASGRTESHEPGRCSCGGSVSTCLRCRGTGWLEGQEPTNRAYWEARGPKDALAIADQLLEIARQHDFSLTLKYHKSYIGLAGNGRACNAMTFRPETGFARFEIRIKNTPETQDRLDAAGLDVMYFDNRWGYYRIRLKPGDVDKHRSILSEIIAEAYAASGQK